MDDIEKILFFTMNNGGNFIVKKMIINRQCLKNRNYF